jgi:hypothetical protein
MCDEKDQNFGTTKLAPSSRQHARSHVPENHKFVTNNNMVIVLHLPYLPDLDPCDIDLFHKLKMKLMGRRF